jgi:hypothetical protein
MYKIEISNVYSQYVKRRGIVQNKYQFLKNKMEDGKKNYENANLD